LENFSYTNYSKLYLTAFKDSLSEPFDTIYHPLTDSIVKIDSSGYRARKMLNEQHLFFTESVTQRSFIKGKRDNKKVLASKTSGFKNPLFALATTELQNFSFYDDYISLTGEEFLNPLTRGSTGRYFFLLEDTTYNSPTDTVFHISFRPRPNYGFKPLRGVLFINSSDWALERIVVNPAEDIGMQVEIEQEFKKVDDHYFPLEYRAQLSIPNIELGGSPALVKARGSISAINTQTPDAKPSRAYVTIEDDAADSATVRLNRYRKGEIDSLELRTYTYMDSLFEEENVEKRLNRLAVLATGKLPLGPIDIDLNRVLKVNREEAVRLGLGAHTSDEVSKWFSVGGFGGYGFRDKTWKYGWDASAVIHEPSELTFKVGYQFDIEQSAIPQTLLKEQGTFQTDNYRSYFADQYDEVISYFSQISLTPIAGIEVLARVNRENVFTRGDYYFLNPQENDAAQWQNGFNYFEFIGELRYTPNSLFVEGDFGKLELGEKYPQINLRYTQGLEDVWESEFKYQQVHLLAEHRHKTLFLGEISLKLEGGYSTADLPYSKLFTGGGNLLNNNEFWERNFTIADLHSFETMRFNEFLSNRFIKLAYRQNFGQLIFKRKPYSPHVAFAVRALWGDMGSPELHRGIPFAVPHLGFYETGLELNRLLGLGFTKLGLGVYYRFGPYQLDETIENFSFKITSRFGL